MLQKQLLHTLACTYGHVGDPRLPAFYYISVVSGASTPNGIRNSHIVAAGLDRFLCWTGYWGCASASEE